MKRLLWAFAGLVLISLDLPAQQLESGTVIAIQADDFENPRAIPLAYCREEQPKQLPAMRAATFTGKRRVLVITVNFQDTAIQYDLEAISALLFTGPDSVDAFYTKMSAGAVGFTGDVVGPFTIGFSNADSGCSYFSWALAADAAAQAAGIPISEYQHKVYVLPYHYSCGWSGLATVGGNPGRVWIMRSDVADIYAHELGHNLGLLHASADYNNDGKVTDECGDSSNIMGRTGQGLRNLNAPHKAQLGWLPVENIVTPAGPMVVQLAPLELAAGETLAPQALKIAKDGTNSAYYFSYRRPVGTDTNLPTAFRNTLSVHHSAPSPACSYLVATLADNVPFVDASTGLTVTMLAHNDGGAKVQMTYACYAARPGLTADSTTVTITNHDSPLCGSTLFQLQATTPNGWKIEMNPATFQLAPGQTGTAQLNVTPPKKLRQATVSTTITVTDNLNPAHTTTVDQNLASDTAAPTAPANVQIIGTKRKIRFRWGRATDNVKVAGYMIWRDGVPLGQVKSTRYTDRLVIVGTTYQYSVTAFDRAGNSSAPSPTVSATVN